jgi:predicted  nucleic acid-binding Zn-ribbon protein
MFMADENKEYINDELDVETAVDLEDSFENVNIVNDGEFLEDADIIELTDKEEYIDEP